jgi:hypothetical protein
MLWIGAKEQRRAPKKSRGVNPGFNFTVWLFANSGPSSSSGDAAAAGAACKL